MTKLHAITSCAQVLTGAKNDYDALLEQIGDARFVLWVKPATARMSFTASAH